MFHILSIHKFLLLLFLCHKSFKYNIVHILFHTIACFYVMFRYVFCKWRSIRPVEINQYDITMVNHYDITMCNDIARDAHCEITMVMMLLRTSIVMSQWVMMLLCLHIMGSQCITTLL